MSASDRDDLPTKTCPACGIETKDEDGFGVLYCENCDYCAHVSITDARCDLCKELVTP